MNNKLLKISISTLESPVPNFLFVSLILVHAVVLTCRRQRRPKGRHVGNHFIQFTKVTQRDGQTKKQGGFVMIKNLHVN